MIAANPLSDIQVYRQTGQIDFRLEFTLLRGREEVEKRITEYLTTLGFKVVEKLDKTYYKRGSFLSVLYSTSPRGVSTVLDVSYDVDRDDQLWVTAEMTVHTTGGMATQKDMDFWLVEMGGIEQSALGQNVDFRLSQYAADRAKWHSCSLILGLIVFGFLAVSVIIVLLLLSPTPAHCGC